MVCDCPNVGNSAGNRLLDHAARLRLVRGARQLNQLFRLIYPELLTALEVLPAGEHRPVARVIRDIEQSLTTFAVLGDSLIDNSATSDNATTAACVDPLAEATGAVKDFEEDAAAHKMTFDGLDTDMLVSRDILHHIYRITDYLIDSGEERHYLESEKPAKHIWLHVEAVLNWLYPTRQAEIEQEKFLENERELFLSWLDTPDGQHWQTSAPWRKPKNATNAAS